MALNNASIMANYYQDFTALLKQLRQYGNAAVVHVEPDMFGYLETLNSSPPLITASVASRDHAELQCGWRWDYQSGADQW
jgi:hypothetical protein